MAIKKIERDTLDKFKPGWRKDRRTGRWVTYELDYYDPESGIRKRKRGFPTEADALDFERKATTSAELRRIGVVQGPRDLPDLREVLERALGDFATKRERVRASRVLRTFVGMLPEGFSIGDVRTRHYKMFADLRLSEKVSAETVNREITVIRSSLRKAHFNFPALEDWTPPKGYNCPASQRQKLQREISEEEERKILKELRKKRNARETDAAHGARIRTACIFEFALMTGLRHGEICQIKKADIKKNELSVFRSKTKVWTTFPLTERMKEIIAESSGLSRSEFVFSTRGKPQSKTDAILRKACAAAGLAYGRKSGLVLHSARHTFITRLLRAGVDIATIQSFSSHTDKAMVMKYSHASDESRRRALGLLGDENRLGLEEIWRKVKAGKMPLKTFLQKVSIN